MIRNENPLIAEERNTEPILLNGVWDFEFDDNNVGHKRHWYKKHVYSRRIEVPFAFQTNASGINETGFHDHMWYHKVLKNIKHKKNERVILCFNGVDYECEVYFNGSLVKLHRGSATSFEVDITDFLKATNDISIYCFDPSTREDMPRGKQYWKEKSESIWYNRTSGIYKSVFIKVLNETHLSSCFIIPDIDKGSVNISANFTENVNDCKICIKDKEDKIINSVTSFINAKDISITLDVWKNEILNTYIHNTEKLWSPENPYLYSLEIELLNNKGKVLDIYKTHFGMRKISTEQGIVCLNNRPYMQKLVLIQGYYMNGLLTPTSVDEYKKDILLAKELGFNGCRLHQKVEEPYFYYLCDLLGFIVWCEYPSAASFSKRLVREQIVEWRDVVLQNFNHPSIVTWVPTNESWGVPQIKSDICQQEFALSLYHLTKSIDSSRLVVSNDGWEMVDTDLCCIHNYSHGGENEIDKKHHFIEDTSNVSSIIKATPAGRNIFADGYAYHGQPILLTEFGGISYSTSPSNGWGYTATSSLAEFEETLNRIYKSIRNSTAIVGYCYTQLYDVESEQNGLLNYDRSYKFNSKIFKALNDNVIVPTKIK